MRPIETFLASKTGRDEDCEDAIFVGESFAAVIDGATSKSPVLFGGRSTGRTARDLLLESLPRLAPGASLAEAADFLSRAVADEYRRTGMMEHMNDHPVDRVTASLVIASAGRRELWMIGDCQALVDGVRVGNDKRVDALLSELRALVLEAAIARGRPVDELLADDAGRQAIQPFFHWQAAFQNLALETPYSFGALDGFPVPSRFQRVVPLPEDTTEIVLASDGYPVLCGTLTESEERLRATLDADPLCFREFRATKGRVAGLQSFDDRAYLRLGF